jgi:RNA polymerase sigma factor (sigma-70 family)
VQAALPLLLPLPCDAPLVRLSRALGLEAGPAWARELAARAAPVRTGRPPAIVARVSEARDLEEERELCERARAGDGAAMGALLRRYGPQLYRSVLLPRLGSAAVAEDALSETYQRVVERFSQFQWQACGFYPWLRVVGMRIAIDHLRARKRETLFEPDDLAREADRAERALTEADAELLEKRDLAAARVRLEEALGRLNTRYATAIRMRVLEERSREEVAAHLGVSVPTFDVVLHRAMTSLKKTLAEPSATPAQAEKTPMKREARDV